MANEKRLIDANELVRKINKLEVFYFTGETDIQIHDCQMVELGAALSEIDDAPIVDAVEVVLCKDCVNWMYEYDDVGLCVTDVPDVDGVQRHACDFCSYGERRTDERKADGID